MYAPGPLPSGRLTQEQVVEILFRELQEISRSSAFAQDLILPYLHVEPTRMVAGMIVNADGSNWNPGSGAGLYRRNAANSAWVFLG